MSTVLPIGDNPRLRIHRLVAALVARQRLAAGIAAEARHLMDPAEEAIEKAFMQIACDHPEACTCIPKDNA